MAYLLTNDNENILIYQVHHVAKKTDKLGSDDLKAKWADDFLNSLGTDEFQNITAEFWTKGGNQNITLNAKITGRGNKSVKVKAACLKVKTEILQCMIDNINDQNGSDESLAVLMPAFDLSTSENYESCSTKLFLLYGIYRLDTIHLIENWLVL